MTYTQLLIFILIIQVIHGLGTWKLYLKAGRKAWEAFIPVYNAVVLMKIINRPWYWTILLFLPIVNLIMFPVVWVETARSFGKNTNIDTFLSVITLGFYIYYINYMLDVEHVKERSLHPKSASGDWISSILFAIVAATIVHTYFMQPYVIPTSSLEKSLLVGDFLIVSKFHYGARVPMTSVAAPMVHDTIPIIKKKSYLFNDNIEENKSSLLSKLQLPYLRIPGFQKIKHNDIVVFNWPVDTLFDMNTPANRNYYKPIDKKTNYVKRCVGLPGDSLSVRDGFVYINGEKNELPDRAKPQFSYLVKTKPQQPLNMQYIHDRYGLNINRVFGPRNDTYQFMGIHEADLNNFKNHPKIEQIIPLKEEEGVRNANIFPQDPNYSWNNDYMGSIFIPKAGATIELNLEILPLYRRVITEYEKNELKIRGNQIFINGELANNYKFKQDYYWLMGDNRHDSQDSRVWGFVPFDHVVGKPVFIWMSYDSYGQGKNKIRWNRVFTTVGGSGEPVSYFIPFIVVLFGWFGFNKWRKSRA